MLAGRRLSTERPHLKELPPSNIAALENFTVTGGSPLPRRLTRGGPPCTPTPGGRSRARRASAHSAPRVAPTRRRAPRARARPPDTGRLPAEPLQRSSPGSVSCQSPSRQPHNAAWPLWGCRARSGTSGTTPTRSGLRWMYRPVQPAGHHVVEDSGRIETQSPPHSRGETAIKPKPQRALVLIGCRTRSGETGSPWAKWRPAQAFR